ncbi:MAG: hypothetical protein CMJ48_07380, partial [Planctomycetaceae bacterium]|nr:hypothetical protein [Planctomycetaceae bacterium]
DSLTQCVIAFSDSLCFKLKQTGDAPFVIAIGPVHQGARPTRWRRRTGLAEIVRDDGWQLTTLEKGQKRSGWPWLIDANVFSRKTVLASPSAVAFASASRRASWRRMRRQRRKGRFPLSSRAEVCWIIVGVSIQPLPGIRAGKTKVGRL